MKRFNLIILLSLISYSFCAVGETGQGNVEFSIDRDLLRDEVVVLALPESNLDSINTVSNRLNDKAEVSTIGEEATKVLPEVLLIPLAEIKTSYAGKANHDAVFMLKRAINNMQLQYKTESEYIPISTQQTIDRVQSYFAIATKNKLDECGVQSVFFDEEVNGKDISTKTTQKTSYLYQVELGVTRLVINKTLFSTSLIGQAEARVFENNQFDKKILVDSFGEGNVTLKKFGTEGAEADNEIKLASSVVIDYLANRLGLKLCGYFH